MSDNKPFKGVDISVYQGDVNFSILAEHVDFAILRLCTTYYGGIKVDTNFLKNYTNAKRVGLPVGVYVYSYNTSTSEASASAEAVVKYLINNCINLELPVWYDFEEVSRNKPNLKADNTAIVEAFITHILDCEFKAGLYTFQSFYQQGLLPDRLKGVDLWIAKWADTPPESLDRDIQIWQYSNSGIVPGIPAVVDLNLCYKKYWVGSGTEPVSDEYVILSERVKALEEKHLKYDDIIKKLKEVLL